MNHEHYCEHLGTRRQSHADARLVPWIDDHEWQHVRSLLFSQPDASSSPSDPSSDIWAALNRIRAWSSRGRLPVAVSSTVALLETMLRDQHQSALDSELKSLYSLAIIRFINGVVDPEQKRANARSVLVIAKELDLDPWLVELRHQATHDPQLPSLPTLRKAASIAVKWLQDHYWDVQGNVLEADIRDLLAEQLTAYKKARKEMLRSAPSSASAMRDAAQKSTTSIDPILTSILALLDATSISRVAIPLLLQDGYLVPSMARVLPTFPGDLPSSQFAIWQPLLAAINADFPWFLHQLALAIQKALVASVLADPTNDAILAKPSRSAALCSWLKYLHRNIEQSQTRSASAARDIAQRAAVFVQHIPTIAHPFFTSLLVYFSPPAIAHIPSLAPLVDTLVSNMTSPSMPASTSTDPITSAMARAKSLFAQTLSPSTARNQPRHKWQQVSAPVVFSVHEVLPLGMTAMGHDGGETLRVGGE
ncbi:Las1-like-domain-containing protein [Catenaria anguillulae PL171]|uniref:Las1-like-domain-containing protein n=1 Tax=Catenaria anguillulae PL171 TaxID=765915 RepID=A0A1Y2HFR4_9FUNG|nr:Las1-like-domain-containing protein [Catenaria anguillulae PL171]